MQVGRPIVFISGHATESEQTSAMMRGAAAFLHKPFSDESLRRPSGNHGAGPGGLDRILRCAQSGLPVVP
jgi:CheY-like chemotaxis protein